MPKEEVARRGGAVRVRTIRTGSGYRHIYVVPTEGARGGHTVAGEERAYKGSSKAKRDRAPRYSMRPARRRARAEKG